MARTKQRARPKPASWKKSKQLNPSSSVDSVVVAAEPSTRPAMLDADPPTRLAMLAAQQAERDVVMALTQRQTNKTIVDIFIADQQDDIRQAELRIIALRKLAPELERENDAETDPVKLRLMYPAHRARCDRVASVYYDSHPPKRLKP